jgi:hypothetical protein
VQNRTLLDPVGLLVTFTARFHAPPTYGLCVKHFIYSASTVVLKRMNCEEPKSAQVVVGVIMSIGARVPQIWLNWKRGDTGQLSLVTYALSSVGNLIRVYTTAVLTHDIVLLASTCAQFALNAFITIQCLQTEIRSRGRRIKPQQCNPTY